jgi:hypothetical protein
MASSAAANACHEFVWNEASRHPDFRADLSRRRDLNRLDTNASYTKKYDDELTKYWLDRDGSRIYSFCSTHLPTWFAELIRKHEPDGL